MIIETLLFITILFVIFIKKDIFNDIFNFQRYKKIKTCDLSYNNNLISSEEQNTSNLSSKNIIGVLFFIQKYFNNVPSSMCVDQVNKNNFIITEQPSNVDNKHDISTKHHKQLLAFGNLFHSTCKNILLCTLVQYISNILTIKNFEVLNNYLIFDVGKKVFQQLIEKNFIVVCDNHNDFLDNVINLHFYKFNFNPKQNTIDKIYICIKEKFNKLLITRNLIIQIITKIKIIQMEQLEFCELENITKCEITKYLEKNINNNEKLNIIVNKTYFYLQMHLNKWFEKNTTVFYPTIDFFTSCNYEKITYKNFNFLNSKKNVIVRANEINTIVELLKNYNKNKLLFVTGPFGCGKINLVNQYITKYIDSYKNIFIIKRDIQKYIYDIFLKLNTNLPFIDCLDNILNTKRIIKFIFKQFDTTTNLFVFSKLYNTTENYIYIRYIKSFINTLKYKQHIIIVTENENFISFDDIHYVLKPLNYYDIVQNLDKDILNENSNEIIFKHLIKDIICEYNCVIPRLYFNAIAYYNAYKYDFNFENFNSSTLLNEILCYVPTSKISLYNNFQIILSKLSKESIEYLENSYFIDCYKDYFKNDNVFFNINNNNDIEVITELKKYSFINKCEMCNMLKCFIITKSIKPFVGFYIFLNNKEFLIQDRCKKMLKIIL